MKGLFEKFINDLSCEGFQIVSFLNTVIRSLHWNRGVWPTGSYQEHQHNRHQHGSTINISYTTSYFLLQTDKLPPLLIEMCSLSRQSLLSALWIIRTMKLLHPTSKMKRAFFHISCLLFISALQFKYGE